MPAGGLSRLGGVFLDVQPGFETLQQALEAEREKTLEREIALRHALDFGRGLR
jgi:hypothetical protein